MTDLSTLALEKLHRGSLQPEDRIAKYFRLGELTRSETASRLAIDNSFPGDSELRAAVHLAREVLDRLREQFGPFSPNSVFRSQAVERALKKKTARWTSTSQHMLGRACDVEIPGKSTLELARWAAANLPQFDQIICECHDPRQGPNSGWVHISLNPPGSGKNRRQLLSYIRDPGNGRYAYVAGLTASIV
jgi:hypothetical protein